MPIHPAPGGFQWGNHGKIYPNRAGAQKQAQAAHANGFNENAAKKHAAKNVKKKASDAAEEKGEPKMNAKQNAIEEARGG